MIHKNGRRSKYKSSVEDNLCSTKLALKKIASITQ